MPSTSFIAKIRHAVRWRIKAFLRRGQDPDAQLNAVLTHFLGGIRDPLTIFDVGSHRGESIARFRRLFPDAELHGFEPDQENFAMLEKNWSDKDGITLNNLGVSAAKGSLTFHRNLKSNTSGFHEVNTKSEWAKNRSARHNVSPEEYTAKSYDVKVIDLDSYIEEHGITRIHLLKIDTQGHEDEVLKGCRKALEQGMIDIIETELIVGDSYMKSLQFHDLEQILIPAGYRFYAIDKGGDLLTTPSLSFNIIYVRTGLS